ncbi:MAG: zinc-ribbon domain-containing protein [Muribaculaceae bacterium]|nr:zinc-ribbon domain-containing protein [Muribaculaceae bacterium]
MERRCPQCGKLTQVSDEELALHGNVVVCPQCLTVYDVSDGVLTASEARERRQQAAATTPAMRYCPACGTRLQDGMRYCPQCGMQLQSWSGHAAAITHADAQVNVEPPRGGDSQPEVDGTDSEKEEGIFHIPFMPYRFNSATFGSLLPKPRASKRMQAVAYTVILLLLALLVAIIVAAYRL